MHNEQECCDDTKRIMAEKDQQISTLTAEVARLEREVAQSKRQAEHYISETGLAITRADQAEAELRAAKGQYTPEEWAEKVDYTRGMTRKLKQAEAELDAARAEVERLWRALECYAREEYWRNGVMEDGTYAVSAAVHDKGATARAALAPAEGKPILPEPNRAVGEQELLDAIRVVGPGSKPEPYPGYCKNIDTALKRYQEILLTRPQAEQGQEGEEQRKKFEDAATALMEGRL